MHKRITLIAIVLLFLIPPLLAWWLYSHSQEWQPGTGNRGQLVTPARPLPAFTLYRLNGTSLHERFLQGKWTLAYIGPSRCTAACLENLYKMRQIRLALNKDMRRVQTLFVLTDTAEAATLAARLSDYPDLIVATPARAQADDFMQAFRVKDNARPQDAGLLYLIDPLGNLILRYAPRAPAEDPLDDLQRLLKISRIG